jgi:hypothetical protein
MRHDMDASSTQTTEQSLLAEVGEPGFWTLVSGVLATLSVAYTALLIVSAVIAFTGGMPHR